MIPVWRLTRNRYTRRIYEALDAAGITATRMLEYRTAVADVPERPADDVGGPTPVSLVAGPAGTERHDRFSFDFSVPVAPYGRSLLVAHFDESTVQRFDRFGAENGPAALFVFFLLPTFPDDLLCAVAGLWNLRPRTFVALLVVGLAPPFFVAAFLGSSVQSGAHFRASVGLTALGLLVFVVYVLRNRIEEHLTA
jgi:hypothetical protein